jgi:hypothetical protein
MSYENPRIKLHMSGMELVTEMSEMNPGALQFCMECLSKGESIDPNSVAGGLTPLLECDNLDFYGSKLYQFWNDVCERDLVKAIGLLRASQLGIIKQDACQNSVKIKPLWQDRPVLDIKSPGL